MASESVDALQNVGFASYGALAVQIWELANSFFDEAEYLCRGRFTIVKWLYIWSRYIPLAAQIASLALTQKMYRSPARAQLCVGAFIYSTIVAEQTLICLEIILLIRVYALYNQNRRVKYLLCTIFLTTSAAAIWSNTQIIRALIKANSCMPELVIPPTALVIVCTSIACFHVLILSMTIFKYYVVGHHHGWARTPLTSLLLREGLLVSFLVFGMMVINVVYESIRTFGLAAGNAAFAWYISLLSIMGCRLILDMRKLPASHPAGSSDNYGIELTSNLDLGLTFDELSDTLT